MPDTIRITRLRLFRKNVPNPRGGGVAIRPLFVLSGRYFVNPERNPGFNCDIWTYKGRRNVYYL